MNTDDYHSRLSSEFFRQKLRATVFVRDHNHELPAENCPNCLCVGHCPGLRCPECEYLHEISWAILRDTEWGYEAVALNDRRRVFAKFEVVEAGF